MRVTADLGELIPFPREKKGLAERDEINKGRNRHSDKQLFHRLKRARQGGSVWNRL